MLRGTYDCVPVKLYILTSNAFEARLLMLRIWKGFRAYSIVSTINLSSKYRFDEFKKLAGDILINVESYFLAVVA